MKRLALLLWVAASLTPFAAEAHDRAAAGASAPVALDPGLGNLHHAVTTSNPKAQAYFDQGLRLSLADFNQVGASVPMFPFDNCRISLPGQIAPQRLIDLPVGTNDPTSKA